MHPQQVIIEMVWTMWQGWKDEETKRIAVERQYAFLEKTLKHVLQQRNELERERDELKNERDELKKQLECSRVDHRVEGRQVREVNICSHCGRPGHLAKKCFFINKQKKPGDRFYCYSQKDLDEAFAIYNIGKWGCRRGQ
jgi:hypothetical protein